MAPFIGQSIGEDQKKKKRSSLQNELVFSPKVCDDQKKVFAYQSVGFWSKKQNKPKWYHPKMVTPGAGRPPPSDATESPVRVVYRINQPFFWSQVYNNRHGACR